MGKILTDEEIEALERSSASAPKKRVLSDDEMAELERRAAPQVPLERGMPLPADLLTAPFKGRLPIGESIPVLGPLAKKAGLALGAGLTSLTDKFRHGEFSDPASNYAKLKAMEEGRAAKLSEENPWATGISSVAGSAVLPVPGTVFKAGADAGKLTQAAAAVGNSAARVGTASALAGVDGAARDHQDPTGDAATAAKIAGAVEALPVVGKAAGKFTRRYVFGVKDKTSKHYNDRRAQVNAVNEEDLKDTVDSARQKLVDDLDNARSSAASGDAKARADLEREIAGHRAGVKEASDAKRANVASAASRSNTEVAEATAAQRAAQRKLDDELRQTKPAPELSARAVESIKRLQERVSKQSGKAFEVLERSGVDVDVKPLLQSIDRKLAQFKIGKAEPTMGTAAEDVARLKALKGQIEGAAAAPAAALSEASGSGYPLRAVLDDGFVPTQSRRATDKPRAVEAASPLKATDLKKLVQLLDDQVGEAYARASQGGYVTRGDRALMALRNEVDGILKGIPEYGKAMAPVARDMQTLKAAQALFKDERAADRTLARLNRHDRQATEMLGRGTGQDFTRELAPYEAARAIRSSKTLRDKAGEGLPESKRVAAARANREAAIRQANEAGELGIQTATTKGEAATAAARGAAENAERGGKNAVESAEAWLGPVRGVTPDQSVSLLRRAEGEGPGALEAGRKLQYLEELGTPGLRQSATDLGVKRALEQGFTRGSRNVNLGASVGSGLGWAAQKLGSGGNGAGFAGAVGAIAGAMADVSGPQAYKFFSDMSASKAFQKYAPMLKTALQKSPQMFSITMDTLGRRDPAFRAYIEQRAAEAQSSMRGQPAKKP